MNRERQFERLTNSPIPLEISRVAGWKELPIRECHEPLVPLGPFSDYWQIFTDSIYFGEREDSPYFSKGREGSLITAFCRKSMAEQLLMAQKLLPRGMYLIAFDVYRSLEVQKSLYDNFYKQLKEAQPNKSDEELTTEAQKYVSLPSTDLTRPSPHNTGGAVDLAVFNLPDDINSEVEDIDMELGKRIFSPN